MTTLALRSEQRESSGLLAACMPMGTVPAIREARTPLQAPDFASTPVRRFVANVCTAEVQHADGQFWQLARACGADAVIDRFETPDIAAKYRLPHERCAGKALAWLSHLQTHDSDRRGLGSAGRASRGPARPSGGAAAGNCCTTC